MQNRPKNLVEAVERVKWASLALPTRQELRIHAGNKEAIEQAARWVFASPHFSGDLNKGLLLMGPKGSGKSHLMRCIAHLLTPVGKGFMVKKCADIVAEFCDTNTSKVAGDSQQAGGYHVIDKYATMERICFDDLCEEPMGKWYGEEVNVMQQILGKRADLMATRRLLTMFTTNHGPEKQEAQYGGRVRDRLSMMHTPFVVDVDPDNSSMGFRQTANVLSWREPEERPIEVSEMDPRLQELMEILANEKNEVRKREIEDQQRKKAIYLEGCISKFRKMTMSELMRAVQLEPYVEAKDMARAEFDMRSPIPLAEVERKAQEEIAARNANLSRKVA